MNYGFLSSLLAGWKGSCPECGRHAQVYKRSIHSAVALQLITLYRLGGHSGMFIHASRLIPEGQSGSGDLSKAKYWSLITERPYDGTKKKSSGYWSLTEAGVKYVRREIMVPQYVMVFDDKVVANAPELEAIDAALGKRFNYQELMNADEGR